MCLAVTIGIPDCTCGIGRVNPYVIQSAISFQIAQVQDSGKSGKSQSCSKDTFRVVPVLGLLGPALRTLSRRAAQIRSRSSRLVPTPDAASLHPSVRFPEHAAASTARRNRLRIAGTCERRSLAVPTLARSLVTAVAIRGC